MKNQKIEQLTATEPKQSTQSKDNRDVSSSNKLAESVTLARAMLLARQGKLKQAEILLLPFLNKPQVKTSTLDLAAKVYAQQGKIIEARTIWLRALHQVKPTDTHILQALLRCAEELEEKKDEE